MYFRRQRHFCEHTIGELFRPMLASRLMSKHTDAMLDETEEVIRRGHELSLGSIDPGMPSSELVYRRHELPAEQQQNRRADTDKFPTLLQNFRRRPSSSS